jgi:integrase
MKNRFWLFKRRNTYYVEDSLSGKQESLHTTDKREAQRLRNAKNEAANSAVFSLALGRAYLAVHDPKLTQRTWSEAMDELATHGCVASQQRCRRAMRSKPFVLIRHKRLTETTTDDFRTVLRTGTVSTNNFLRRLHNLAIGLGWLPWPILPPKLWPKIIPKPRRAITWEEHVRIVSTERNPERRLYYEVLWETGASQTDAVSLTGQDIDWCTRTVTYRRHKTGQSACLVIGSRLERILKQLPAQGPLFPTWSLAKDKDRAGEFRRRCRILEIEGVTLHSYRYAWAERAKSCGYPERFAQQALGHSSRAVHQAYAKRARVRVPTLEEYENAYADEKIIPMRLQSVPTIKEGSARARGRTEPVGSVGD